MVVSAFCPSYITGIFTIGNGDAAGAGFAIDRGMLTNVRQWKRGIAINGKKCAAPVSRSVLAKYASLGYSTGNVWISHQAGLPIGFGMGMSAAGALSLSLALNELYGAGLGRKECVKIAHDAEVECGTGLSGADAASLGGVLALRRIGEMPIRLPFEEREISLAFYSPIRTKSIIGSQEWAQKVNEAGEVALSGLFRNPNWDTFVEKSRQFSISSGLAGWCETEMENNRRASMAMVGQALFSDSQMALPSTPRLVAKAKLYEQGARVL